MSLVRPEMSLVQTETLSLVQPATLSVQPATSVQPAEVVEGNEASDGASIGASLTESALCELFTAEKKTPPSKKKNKTKERTQPSVGILREMRCAAAFDAQTFVFTQINNTSKEG